MGRSSSYRSQCPYGSHSALEEKKEDNTPFFSKRQEKFTTPDNSSGFFQTKLSIGAANDQYEQEADNVAGKVVNNNSAAPAIQQKEITGIQRLATPAEDEKLGTNEERMRKDKMIQHKQENGKEEERGMMQKKENDKEEEKPGAVQRKSDGGGTASTALSSRVQNTAGKGQTLPAKTLAEMSRSFGYDFSHVNIHTGSEAESMNKELSAQAFTHGSDIYFNSGKFDPESATGKHLLAHELTHVVQQGSSGALKGINKLIQKAQIYTGTIMDEGSCAHLACNSTWACDDPAGVLCPDGTLHAGHRKRPLFTCDTNCENNQSCSDTAHWMALPGSRFTRRKCGQDLVICANNSFTHAQVRDRSVTRNGWEVSHGVQDSLGLSSYGNFTGSVYPNETDPAFLSDSRCR